MVSQKINIMSIILILIIIIFLLISIYNPVFLIPAIGISLFHGLYNKTFLPIPFSLILTLILGLHNYYFYPFVILALLVFLLFILYMDKMYRFPFK
ncbi:hypothetical protein DDW01_01170 [Sulfolobus sp. SCGC AB-777_G05]|nr:hypothetical protein DDW01_01170 [Sulfolobus sp. SCGC AB-777_G05]